MCICIYGVRAAVLAPYSCALNVYICIYLSTHVFTYVLFTRARVRAYARMYTGRCIFICACYACVCLGVYVGTYVVGIYALLYESMHICYVCTSRNM